MSSSRAALNVAGKFGTQMAMHSLSQGYINGISGGDFSQGFWSAMMSSAVSSYVQNVGVPIIGDGDLATMLFGSVSGGLSAELAGGNF